MNKPSGVYVLFSGENPRRIWVGESADVLERTKVYRRLNPNLFWLVAEMPGATRRARMKRELETKLLLVAAGYEVVSATASEVARRTNSRRTAGQNAAASAKRIATILARYTPEERSAWARTRAAGGASRKGGVAAWAKKTPEQRREWLKKMNGNVTHEELSARGRQGAAVRWHRAEA